MFRFPRDEHRYDDDHREICCYQQRMNAFRLSLYLWRMISTPSLFHLSIKQRQMRRSSSILLFVLPEHVLRWDRNGLLIALEHRHLDSASFERCVPFLPIVTRWTSFDCVVSFVSRLEWDHRHPTTNQPRVGQRISCSVPYRTGLNATARQRTCEIECHCVAASLFSVPGDILREKIPEGCWCIIAVNRSRCDNLISLNLPSWSNWILLWQCNLLCTRV